MMQLTRGGEPVPPSAMEVDCSDATISGGVPSPSGSDSSLMSRERKNDLSRPSRRRHLCVTTGTVEEGVDVRAGVGGTSGGGGPVSRRFSSLFKRSNQKGAPSEIATIVRIIPRILRSAVTQSVGK